MSDKKDPVFIEADKYRDYFKEDEQGLDDLVTRLSNLQKISDKQIEEISAVAQGRGTQHYLIEHITNAIAIQNQLQSVLKDKRQIKEKSLDIALKSIGGQDVSDAQAVISTLSSIINKDKINAQHELEKFKSDNFENIVVDDESIDNDIEEKLKRLGK